MKRFFALAAFAALAIGLAPAAHAEEITLIGFTDGCFGAGCIPSSSSGLQTATFLGLTYQNSTFNSMTSANFLALGANGTALGTQNFNNLGAFTLSSAANTYNGSFTLRTTFTAPATIVGSNTTLFTATLTGSVSGTANGGVFLNFDNTPIHYVFSNAQKSGSFDFSVLDVSINAGQTAPIDALVTGSQSGVPEPGTYAMLGLGLLGMGLARRKLAAR